MRSMVRTAGLLVVVFGVGAFWTDRDGRMLGRPDGSHVSVRDLFSFDRYAIEGELLPVPFADLRWTLRVIAPVAARDASGAVLRHERRRHLQFHCSQ